MKIRKVTAISVQTDEALVVRRQGAGRVATCQHEAANDAMVSPEEAAALLDLPVRRVYRLIEEGWLHFEDTRAGRVKVCLESLSIAVRLAPDKTWPEINSQIKDK